MQPPPVLTILFVVGWLIPTVKADEANPIATATEHVRSEFERLDVDHDQRLSLDEFLIRGGDRRVLERDFRLYDFDADERISPAELAAVAGLTEPMWRGRLPDPYDQLTADAVAALDQSYDDWQQRPGEQVNAHSFVAKFIASISDGGPLFVTGRLIVQADRDADGQISRLEAKHFLQQQLGVSWYDGPPLREPTGRLVRLDRFLAVDQDRDNQLSRDEFLAHWWNRSSAEEDFLLNDRDGNGQVSYAEFAHPASANYFDPIEWFRRADTDLDAMLDADELAAASDRSRRHLVASTLAAFDDDDNGKLSLQEYRLSMHANVNYSWHALPLDLDRDGRLSYGEFVFNNVDLFQLQRRYFFHRLDRDGDGRLSSTEFDFRKQTADTIQLRSATGSDSRRLYQDDRYPHAGWPSVSPNGLKILFQRGGSGDGVDGRIAVIGMDGRGLRELCDGSHPSWSADGQRFACTRRVDGEEIWIISADGYSGQPIADGRAPAWSPDGESIAYLHDNGLWIYDVRRGQTREIFRREDHRYRDLGDDLAWSPDSGRLALLGNRDESAELVIFEAAAAAAGQPKPRIRFRFPTPCGADLSWSQQQGIILSRRDAERPRTQLLSINPDDQSDPRRIGAFGSGVDWKSACVTADGKWYIAVSK